MHVGLVGLSGTDKRSGYQDLIEWLLSDNEGKV